MHHTLSPILRRPLKVDSRYFDHKSLIDTQIEFFLVCNHFRCIFESHFFRVYFFFSKQEACQKVLCEQKVNEIMPGCHPSYLETVSQQVVCRIRTHSLRFLTPNTAFLVRIIQIHTNFGCLKWLHTKKISIWVMIIFV